MPDHQYHIATHEGKNYETNRSTTDLPTFSYNYTYDYPWLQKPEALLRRCEFDDGGYMELTDNRLIIFEDWRYQQFSLPQIKKANIAFKRLIAPIIIGGIISPLSFVAAFGNVFSFWFSMAFFLIGILLFYYGIQGSYQVSVEFEGHHFRFFIDEKTEEVESFIHYLNTIKSPMGISS